MNESAPKPDYIAAQLRKPSGGFAATIAQNMDKTNEFLFDFTLQSMGLKGGERLLEIGFGSGRFMRRIFSLRDDIRLYGIDGSPEMVGLASDTNSDLVSTELINLQEANSNNIPFDDSTFDIVFCNMVIYFWDNVEEHISEIWRVLKPGGRFYAGFRTKESMMNFPFVKYGFTLYSPSEWQTVMESNRFVVIGTDRRMDPVMEANGQKVHLESVCVVAQKQPPV